MGDTIRFYGGDSAGAFDLSVTAPSLVDLDPPWFTKHDDRDVERSRALVGRGADRYVAARDSIDRDGWTIGASAITWYGATWSQAGEVTLE